LVARRTIPLVRTWLQQRGSSGVWWHNRSQGHRMAVLAMCDGRGRQLFCPRSRRCFRRARTTVRPALAGSCNINPRDPVGKLGVLRDAVDGVWTLMHELGWEGLACSSTVQGCRSKEVDYMRKRQPLLRRVFRRVTLVCTSTLVSPPVAQIASRL
jgi:hypothetical protein